jgi:TPP-dependent pyruvate/acetoin dehydrogenase alpha subunit
MASKATKTKKSPAKPLRREPAAPLAPKSVWENPLIPHAKYQQLYTAMLRAQMLEAKLPAAQRAPEAVAAGLIIDLRPEDVLISPAPSHRFLKGVALKSLAAKKQPRKADPGFPAQNILPTIADSAAAIYAAVGVAFTQKLNSTGGRNSNIVLAFTTDAAACMQAARLAEEHRLPILFVFPQNGANAALTMATRRYGIPGMPVDRDDTVAVYRVAQEAIARARSGGGPTLIECMRYSIPRQRSQSGLLTLERNLTKKGLFTPQWKRILIAGFRRELAKAAQASRKASKTQ